MNTFSASGSDKTATFLIALSATLYGLLAYFGTQLIHANFSINNMLLWRFVIASLWMLGYAMIRNKNARRICLPKQQDVLLVFVLGAVFYSGSCGFYFLATRYMGTGLAMVIFFSYPMVVALFALFTERSSITLTLLIALLGMLAGLWLLHGQKTDVLSVFGVMYAVLAAISYALYVLATRWTTHRMSSDISTIIVSSGCATTFFLLTLLTHTLSLPHSFRDSLLLLALGVLATAMPIQLMLEGLRRVSALRASVLSSLEPLVTVVMGIAFLGETISLAQTTGCLLLLFSALVIQWQGLRG